MVLLVMVFSSLALDAQAANAFPPGDPVFAFDYSVVASTHLKNLNQTITVPPGTFSGGIDLTTDQLVGAITLPAAKFTLKLAGVLGVVTATAKIVSTKPVTGIFSLSDFTVKATATFNIRIVNAYAKGVPVNLVGNSCITATPVSVTMAGAASLDGPSTFTGTFTLPKLKTCGAATTALNLVMPGPGNTFTATATPSS